ncbi:MAG: site-specific integrase [Euryarchaeota archaeon]|nr:site-specific integrase [Euryarchaeota archaeon]
MRSPEGETRHQNHKNDARDRRRQATRDARLHEAGTAGLPYGLLPGRAGRPPTGQVWQRHSQEREFRDAKDEAAVVSAIAGLSPECRPDVEAFLRLRRRRSQVGQIRRYAETLADLHRFTHATPWDDVTPDQCGAWTERLLGRVSPETAGSYALLVQGFLRHRLALRDRLLPHAFRVAFDTGENEDEKKARRVPDNHFLAMVARNKNRPCFQALFWVLFDTGFRINEALSLNVGHVRFEEGGVTLSIPPRSQARFRLKNKRASREVWVLQCRAALEAWLEEHPFRDTPDAPLFLTRDNQHATSAWLPMGRDAGLRRLKASCTEAGVPAYTCHDFRHNKAFTMKMFGNVTDSDMCAFFGWADGSSKPRYYGRIVAADLRAKTRAQAGINNVGQHIVIKEGEAEAKLRILQDALRLITDPGARPNPPPS